MDDGYSWMTSYVSIFDFTSRFLHMVLTCGMGFIVNIVSILQSCSKLFMVTNRNIPQHYIITNGYQMGIKWYWPLFYGTNHS